MHQHNVQGCIYPWKEPASKSVIFSLETMRAREKLLKGWYKSLGLIPQTSPGWYRDRLREELVERRYAETSWRRLSETSDIFFTITRAEYDGFSLRSSPSLSSTRYISVYMYMISKYSMRWLFYRAAAYMSGARRLDLMCEVVNLARDRKLEEMAQRHHLDPNSFKELGRQLRRVWPLLPYEYQQFSTSYSIRLD